MRELLTTIIEINNNESITVVEFSIYEYQENLLSVVNEYGEDDTIFNLTNKVMTPTTLDILHRLVFAQIGQWTIKDDANNPLPLTFENYLALPHSIGGLVSDAINAFGEVDK